jgi:hypothetical protein
MNSIKSSISWGEFCRREKILKLMSLIDEQFINTKLFKSDCVVLISLSKPVKLFLQTLSRLFCVVNRYDPKKEITQ